MKNGKVVTNPGKCNPDIVKPDGDYDRTISAVAVKQEGRIAAILVNLANHGTVPVLMVKFSLPHCIREHF